ncbi:hypothetical protein B0H16DRAFT_557304 [Mycena metata]|uniref:DUF7918 domain-containing protein n=1 Tax=Mycena metata TaxID=1033252 RepID=A0AAD7JBJ6_9AGAR|nr:hypothetical protein B0H16DRAFT_557304 [Mycena metata]
MLINPLPRSIEHRGSNNDTTLRPFIFSTLALTDDDSLLGSSSHPELGLIQLTIVPVQATETNTSLALPSLAELKVHERSKKAVTQQITLAEPEILATPPKTYDLVRIGPNIANFSFKYRPLDVLRANEIAPQLKRKASPEIPRAATPEDPEALADTREAEILRERLKALDAKLQKRVKKPNVKDELAGQVIDLTQNSARSNKRVKLEERRPFIPGEVIDLT